MSKKKKTEKIGVIKGIDVIRKSKPINDIPFREGTYLTQKDRPRDKSYKKARYNYDNA
jgi:hypothetical protein